MKATRTYAIGAPKWARQLPPADPRNALQLRNANLGVEASHERVTRRAHRLQIKRLIGAGRRSCSAPKRIGQRRNPAGGRKLARLICRSENRADGRIELPIRRYRLAQEGQPVALRCR